MTTLTLRYVRGEFLVTGRDIELRKLVLVVRRSGSDDARGSRGHFGGGSGIVQKSWKNLSDAARPRRSRTRASRDRTTEEEALLVAQGQASGGTERSPIAPPQERGRRANKE